MEVRIYAEVLDQALFFQNAIESLGYDSEIVYTNGALNKYKDTSLVSLLRNHKKFDLLISVIKNNVETPWLMVEFSTAVTTDDHELQRADAMFWAYHYRVPYLKIAPTHKLSQTAGRNFGGGRLLSIEDQLISMFKKNGIMYHINWNSMDTVHYTFNDTSFHSCPKVDNELVDIISELLEQVNINTTRDVVYDALWELQKNKVVKGKTLLYWWNTDEELLNRLSLKSPRLAYDIEKKEMRIKISRYGHAMDPERGMLAFWRLMLGDDWNIIAEIQIERSSTTGRLSYKSLFGGLPIARNHTLMSKANKILSRERSMTLSEAIELHSIATNSMIIETQDSSENVNTKYMSDETLEKYLGMGEATSVYKNILYYSNSINFLDKNLDTIGDLKWNNSIVYKYFNKLEDDLIGNFIPLPIRKLAKVKEINEDIITWSTKEVLIKEGYKILAISYPGAQGDRCVLIGNGKSALRKYIDIIALNEETKQIVVVECKDKLSKSVPDCAKLNEIIQQNKDSFERLMLNLGYSDLEKMKVNTVVAGIKDKEELPHLKVDSIIEFNFIPNYSQLNWRVNNNLFSIEKGSINIEKLKVTVPIK